MMSNPNLGPELSDSGDPGNTESNRRGNPASAHLEETPSRVIEAAQARAATVSHRFGGTRYALTRPGVPAQPTDDAKADDAQPDSGDGSPGGASEDSADEGGATAGPAPTSTDESDEGR